MWYAAAAATVVPKLIWFIADEIAQSSYSNQISRLVSYSVCTYINIIDNPPWKKDHYSEQSFGSRGWEPIKYVDEAYF